MFRTRQRRMAWMFALVLALELALLCCASMHLTDHSCSGDDSCVICACVRGGLRRSALVMLLLAAFIAFAAICTGSRAPGRCVATDSLILRKTRMND